MNTISKMLIEMARFYSYELGERQLEMYVDVLSQFPEDQVLNAGRSYVRDIKNKTFPMPPHSILKDSLPKEASNDALAKEAAARLIESVRKFGYNRRQDAREYIGELGWRAVERFGGWHGICMDLGVGMSVDTFYAQVRELCKSTLELEAAGISNQPIGLDTGKTRGGQLESSGEIIKRIGVKPKMIDGGVD